MASTRAELEPVLAGVLLDPRAVHLDGAAHGGLPCGRTVIQHAAHAWAHVCLPTPAREGKEGQSSC